MTLLAFLLLYVPIYVATNRPNIIFILTDDQDIRLESMQALPNTIKYLVNEGLTFNNTFISTPICCPSRTETITGRNYQNIINQGGDSCMHVSSEFNLFNNTNSMFQIFKQNGYLTGSFGKLTNDMSSFWCNKQPILNGFDRINCPCDFNNFYGLQYFDKYINGTTHLYNLNLDQNAYETSYVGNASINWLTERMIDQSTNKDAKPFIMWIGPHAPHFPATPAAWYVDRFNDAIAPHTPNYNVCTTNHHSFVSSNPHIDDNATIWINQLYRDRLRSLLSVDDLVYDMISILEEYPDQFNNTYILYTSDHGYHLGQYDLPCSKMQPYEETIRIPMFLRGPNIKKHSFSMDMVGNIDILPSFLDIAGIEYDRDLYDGRSWVNSSIKQRQIYLTQYQASNTLEFDICTSWWPSSNGSLVPGDVLHPPSKNSNGQTWYIDNIETNNWRALRIMNETVNWMYAEFVNQSWDQATFDNPYIIEFYDIQQDPYQINNSYNYLSNDLKNALHQMLMNYGNCSGISCW